MRWYTKHRIALIIRKDEFSTIYQNYCVKNIKYLKAAWVQSLKTPGAARLTMDQFINQPVGQTSYWVRSKSAGIEGNPQDNPDDFFEIHSVTDAQPQRSVIFTPLVTVDKYGASSFNARREQTDLSNESIVIYVEPDHPEFADEIAAISAKYYSSKALFQDLRNKLEAYLPGNFDLEQHTGILEYTYQLDK